LCHPFKLSKWLPCNVITFPNEIPFHTYFSGMKLTASVVELNFLLFCQRDSQLIINEFNEEKFTFCRERKIVWGSFFEKCYYFTLCLLLEVLFADKKKTTLLHRQKKYFYKNFHRTFSTENWAKRLEFFMNSKQFYLNMFTCHLELLFIFWCVCKKYNMRL
jgi:hypothetical protein